MSLTIVYPEDDFENVQFDVETDGGELREGRLFFNGLWGMFTVCRVRIQTKGDKKVVIISELTDNPGEPIGKTIEKIATFIHSRLLSRVSPSDITWIEHYQDAGYIPFLKGRHSILEVSFKYERDGRLHIYSHPKRGRTEEQWPF
ncbi:MAG: hypothetical protein ACYC69_17195 [Thermodesulfovibrionales bacterium]